MRTLTLNIPISEELLFALKKDEQSLQEEARKILAMQFFKERKLSLGKAAELAGRQYAYLLGLNVIGVLGILLIGKKLGFVEEIRPLMDIMIKYNRYISRKLYLTVLRKAEEIR